MVAKLLDSPGDLPSGASGEEVETVEVGDRVMVVYNDRTGRHYTIRISEADHDPDMHIIGADQPMAHALLGATVDDEVEIGAGEDGGTVTIIDIDKATDVLPAA